jgi:nitrite reductase/ring-hydroxylating ferredoxin subunit
MSRASPDDQLPAPACAVVRPERRVLGSLTLLRPDVAVAVWRDGREYVVWTDGSGRMCATSSRCPHRGASFAGGKIIDGQLTCPVHGWRFDHRGEHVFRPDGQPLTQARLRCHELTAHDGRLYVADAESDPQSTCSFANQEQPDATRRSP